jgi:L-threonylcarbamoyladenylate synthase
LQKNRKEAIRLVTKKIKLNRNDEKFDFGESIEIIRNGGLVAFPTETVYGLGGDATNPEASKKIYAAKGRPSDNPLIVHIHDFSELEAIASEVPEDARKLNEAFWPGPLTMIVKKNDVIPYETTGGIDTVAVRMPSHPIARAFLTESNVMIAAPSANTSGRPSPTTAHHVEADLDGKIDCIIDGGSCDIGLESSIIDLSTDVPTILRPGYINKEMFEEVLGKEVIIDPAILNANANKGLRPKAPGMKYRHYAPKANLTVVEGESSKVVTKINELAKEAHKAGKKVGIVATDETKELYSADYVVTIGERNDENSIAKHLYGVLRDFDDMDVNEIYSESFGTPKLGMAIMNRLLKAAGHQVIKVD